MKTKEKILSRFLAVMASVCLCMFVWTMTMTVIPENYDPQAVRIVNGSPQK